MIGSAAAAAAESDGYTLLISGNASHVIGPAFYGNATYDGVKSFTHIAYVGGAPVGLLVHSSLNIKSYREFVAWAKAQNKPVDYVSSGTATHGFLFGAELARKEGFALNHIPYKGAGPALLDLVAGHVRVATISFSAGAPHVRSGTLRALAVSTDERLPTFPDVPTFKELGHAGHDGGIVVCDLRSCEPAGPHRFQAQSRGAKNPAGTGCPAASRQGRLSKPVEMSAEELQKFFVSETERWGSDRQGVLGVDEVASLARQRW